MVSACVLATAAPAGAIEIHQGISPIYNATTIQSERASTYSFHSPGFSYGIRIGREVVFLGRLTGYFPTALYQDGRYYHSREYYDPRIGGEALLGAAYVFALKEDQRVVTGAGVHLNSIRLASTTFEAFYSATLGAGVDVEYFYPLNRYWDIGAFADVAVDVADLIHDANGLAFGVYITAGITISLGLGK